MILCWLLLWWLGACVGRPRGRANTGGGSVGNLAGFALLQLHTPPVSQTCANSGSQKSNSYVYALSRCFLSKATSKINKKYFFGAEFCTLESSCGPTCSYLVFQNWKREKWETCQTTMSPLDSGNPARNVVFVGRVVTCDHNHKHTCSLIYSMTHFF